MTCEPPNPDNVGSKEYAEQMADSSRASDLPPDCV